MLNRTMMPVLRTEAPLSTLRHGVLTNPTSLLKFLIGLLVVFCVFCLYLWQLSSITTIQAETASLRRQERALERQNVALMLQIAQWDSPAYVESKATELGLRPGPAPVYVTVTPSDDAARSGRAIQDTLATLWARLTLWLGPPAAAANGAP